MPRRFEKFSQALRQSIFFFSLNTVECGLNYYTRWYTHYILQGSNVPQNKKKIMWLF